MGLFAGDRPVTECPQCGRAVSTEVLVRRKEAHRQHGTLIHWGYTCSCLWYAFRATTLEGAFVSGMSGMRVR